MTPIQLIECYTILLHIARAHVRRLTYLTRLLALLTLLSAGCAPPAPPQAGQVAPSIAPTRPPAAGIGVCHWIAAEGLPDQVDWGTETTTVTHWNTMENLRGIYNLAALDKYVLARQQSHVKPWLAFQTYGANNAGQPTAPQWLIDDGAIWHDADCSNHRAIFAPWDPVYLTRLELLLAAINLHITSQPPAYRDTIAGIVMMTGGVYGESHLYQWSQTCNIETALREHYGLTQLTPQEFDHLYTQAILHILDLYMTAFPDWPIMLQLGRPSVDAQILHYAANSYPGRVYAKWAGWSPTNVGDGRDHHREKANQYYTELFATYYDRIPCGFEPGHPTQEWLGPAQYLNAIQSAIDANITFACFQAGDTLWQAYTLDQWAAFDTQLEANAVIPITPTPTSTCTPTPTDTPTPTCTPTFTPTPALPSINVIWQCDCRPITVTPEQ